MLLATLGQWSHVLAAIAYTGLALWLLQRRLTSRSEIALICAAASTAIWALMLSLHEGKPLSGTTLEDLSELAWLAFMFVLLVEGETKRSTDSRSIKLLYGVVGLVQLARLALALSFFYFAGLPRVIEAASRAEMTLHMITDVGALVLVHNLYSATTDQSRPAIRLPMIALALLWGYDFNLYTIAYLAHALPLELLAARGFVLALLTPLLGLGIIRAGTSPVQLSRRMTFQSLSLVAIGAYLILMVGGTEILQLAGPQLVRTFQVSFVFVSAVAALILLPSPRMRAWIKVMVAKHLFQHRYDYRAEWLRFTDTLGRVAPDSAALDTRVIQAVADITESTGGLLLTPNAGDGLRLQARWNWVDITVPERAADQVIIPYLETSGRIIELDTCRRDDKTYPEARVIPEWLAADNRAWVLVPLIHFGQLTGIIVLERPLFNRTLDWEDFDLLRVAGRQVASYLAEATGQEMLSDVQRFDEFNRRFAFIMHDIKNLVSQLSLVSRNAERHIGNPAFQRDMLATLDNSTKRMNDLLRRLSQHHKVSAAEPRAIELGVWLDAIIAPRRAHHPIILSGDTHLFGIADPAQLEQALGHLLQNAIDASQPSDPVTVHLSCVDGETHINITDAGCGMGTDFIRDQLFKPFASTKEGGFGIGAYEARALIQAMGGRLQVRSRLGKGSHFTIRLPTEQPQHISFQDIAA